MAFLILLAKMLGSSWAICLEPNKKYSSFPGDETRETMICQELRAKHHQLLDLAFGVDIHSIVLELRCCSSVHKYPSRFMNQPFGPHNPRCVCRKNGRKLQPIKLHTNTTMIHSHFIILMFITHNLIAHGSTINKFPSC